VTQDFSPSLSRISHGPVPDGLFIPRNKSKISRAISNPKAVQTTPLDVHTGSAKISDVMLCSINSMYLVCVSSG
jgi:hypothetical protein